MQTKFTARHIEPSDNLKKICLEAVSKLEQFYDRIVSCDIVLEPSPSAKNPQKAEIIVKVPHKVLTATEQADKYEKAILDAVENMARQLKRYKEKKFQTH